MARTQHSDPKEGGAKPPFPEQQQKLPGSTQRSSNHRRRQRHRPSRRNRLCARRRRCPDLVFE